MIEENPILSERRGERTFTFDKPGSYTITNTAHANTLYIVVR